MATKKTNKPAKLHYDKEALLQEYKNTFKIALWTVSAIIAFALLYFFVLATYLGGWGHTKHEPFHTRYSEEIDMDYDGLKLPMYKEE
jgi:uncharacterized sodium:solute symporter family permease YidK